MLDIGLVAECAFEVARGFFFVDLELRGEDITVLISLVGS